LNAFRKLGVAQPFEHPLSSALELDPVIERERHEG